MYNNSNIIILFGKKVLLNILPVVTLCISFSSILKSKTVKLTFKFRLRLFKNKILT